MARKYSKGELITSIDELMKQDVVYIKDRVMNRGWFQNWQLRFIFVMVHDRKIVYKAIKKGDQNGI